MVDDADGVEEGAGGVARDVAVDEGEDDAGGVEEDDADGVREDGGMRTPVTP